MVDCDGDRVGVEMGKEEAVVTLLSGDARDKGGGA